MSSHSPANCCNCLMSRRCFLGTVSAAAVAGQAVGAAAPPAPEPGNLSEYLDLSAFRPQPEVRVYSAILRLPPPYWLGWPGTAYDLEGHRKEYTRKTAEAARNVGVTLTQVEQPLETDEAVDALVRQVTDQKPDAVLLTLQHLNVWKQVDKVAKTGVPTIVFAPIGTAFTGHVLEISRRPGVHVISSLEMAPVEQALRMVRAKKQLAASRLLVIAGNERKEETIEGLDTKVRRIPRDTLHLTFEKMPVTDEVREVARLMKKGAKDIVEPTADDLLNSARSFVTAKRLLKDEESNGVTSDCLGMVSSRVVPTPPCMAATMFQDAGITYGCEADVYGAISLMLSSYLVDKPGFMNDPVPETYKNLLIAAHCSSGTRLNGFKEAPEPYILRSHSESNLGVSTQVLWREGQKVTLVRFTGPKELIVDTGTVVGNVSTPPAGGCRTSFEIAMDRIDDVRDVKGFHQVVFYGDHKRDVEAFCQMYGIKAIHSPSQPPEPETA